MQNQSCTPAHLLQECVNVELAGKGGRAARQLHQHRDHHLGVLLIGGISGNQTTCKVGSSPPALSGPQSTSTPGPPIAGRFRGLQSVQPAQHNAQSRHHNPHTCATSSAARSQVSSAARSQRSRPSSTADETMGSRDTVPSASTLAAVSHTPAGKGRAGQGAGCGSQGRAPRQRTSHTFKQDCKCRVGGDGGHDSWPAEECQLTVVALQVAQLVCQHRL